MTTPPWGTPGVPACRLGGVRFSDADGPVCYGLETANGRLPRPLLRFCPKERSPSDANSLRLRARLSSISGV